jgi:glycosyltransferase involved in cell wall biosynthesis
MPSHPALIFVTPAYGELAPGGLAVSARRIVGHLAEAYPVTVITPSDLIPPLSHRVSNECGLKVVEVGKVAEPGMFLQFLADVIETVSRTEPNPLFLSFYCNAMAYATTLAARRQGVSPLLFARGNDIDLDVFGESAFQIHYALSHARKVFCVSREIQSKVQAFCPTAQTQYIPNGVDVDHFAFQDGYAPSSCTTAIKLNRKTLSPGPSPCKGEGLTVHQILNLKAVSLRPVIGLFGDIKQKKGLDTLLAAMDFGRYRLRIVGELREESQKLLHGFVSLNPQALAQIELVPYIQERDGLLKHYREVDIVCIPSRHEGMSNVMLEAMAVGKLCVCSAVGGALDVIRDGENGYLFDPHSPESLRLALERAALCLSEGHESVRREASRTIREGFSAALERERYLEALRAICR